MTLGEKIKLLRTEQEMTQPSLAEKAGIEQSYLSKLENDKGAPSFDIINRIAIALGTTGMALVQSLSRSYVEENLAHLPEIAAEYESVRLKEKNRARNILVSSSLAMILGAGLGYLGYSGVFFPERAWDYRSAGVIFPGEPNNLFEYAFPRPPGTFIRMSEQQQEALDTRVNIEYFVSYKYLGKTFVSEDSPGKRIFEEYSTREIQRRENDILLAFGIMLYIAGMIALGYSIQNRNKPSGGKK